MRRKPGTMWIAISAAAVLVAGMVTVTWPASAEETASSVTADQAPASVAYLRQRYGVSEAEAVRRLDLQRASTDLAARLAAQFPDQYAGMWLDQANGGVLKVGMTDPGRLTAALRGTRDAAHIKAVPVKRSLKQLAATARQLAAGGNAQVVVDAPTNSVLVKSRDTAGLVQKSCDPRHCARAPMMGGIRLDVTRDDGTYGGCTTGFNLRSVVTGDFYLLTAGHCVNNTNHRNLDKTYHELYGPNWPVTEERTTLLAENAYPFDYAVMPYQPGAATRWFQTRGLTSPSLTANRVNYWCPGGCAGSHDVSITGYVAYDAIQVGWVACATGSGYTPAAGERYVDSGAGAGYIPGTRCGQIFGKSNGGIDVHICARPGDSGGPLFTEADGKALGILSNGDPGSGPCTNPNERNFYAPISKVLAQANTRTSDKFMLVSRPPAPPGR
jgi:streptogrisin C